MLFSANLLTHNYELLPLSFCLSVDVHVCLCCLPVYVCVCFFVCLCLSLTSFGLYLLSVCVCVICLFMLVQMPVFVVSPVCGYLCPDLPFSCQSKFMFVLMHAHLLVLSECVKQPNCILARQSLSFN